MSLVKAFPHVTVKAGDNYNPPTKMYHPGMGLRDYFAAAALQGLIASYGFKESGLETIADFVAESYVIADAMIKEREK